MFWMPIKLYFLEIILAYQNALPSKFPCYIVFSNIFDWCVFLFSYGFLTWFCVCLSAYVSFHIPFLSFVFLFNHIHLLVNVVVNIFYFIVRRWSLLEVMQNLSLWILWILSPKVLCSVSDHQRKAGRILRIYRVAKRLALIFVGFTLFFWVQGFGEGVIWESNLYGFNFTSVPFELMLIGWWLYSLICHQNSWIENYVCMSMSSILWPKAPNLFKQDGACDLIIILFITGKEWKLP